MEQNQTFLLDKQTFRFSTVTNNIALSNSNMPDCMIMSITIIPHQFKIEPFKIKESFIRKSSDKNEILKQLNEGQYFVN